MRRFMIPGAIVLVAVGVLALLAFGVLNQGSSSSIDAQVATGHYPRLPDARFAMQLLGSHKKLSIADFRGKVVVLNEFASWCDPCVAEAPVLTAEQRALTGHDATVIGVTYLDNPIADQQFAQQQHLNFPVLEDVSGGLARALGTNGVPETFVIDRQGRIHALQRYPVTKQWLAQALRPVLGQA